MGRNIVNKESSSFLSRKSKENSFMNSIHRARVTDVYVDEGTVNVLFESLAYSRKVTIPLLGLSVPPKMNESDKNYLRSSWGRYIPQVGDSLLIAFDANGTAYALGYHAIFYEGFDQYDQENEARGGIGWGPASGRERLRPGDWDFMSARNSVLHLGDRAKIRSGPHSININKPTGDITTTTTLEIENVGESSEIRRGGARRRVLPTDEQETNIYSARGGQAQEVNYDIRYGGLIPGGTTIARKSCGDVINDTLFSPMIGEAGQFVRDYTLLKDLSGNIDVYEEKIDTLGNFVVSANLATKFSWTTPLAQWSVNNLSTSLTAITSVDITGVTVNITSSGSMSLNSTGTMSLSSSASVAVSAPSISLSGFVNLGSAAATDRVVKGDSFSAAMVTFLTVLSASLNTASIFPPNLPLAAAGVAAATLAALLPTPVCLSTTVRTV